MLGPVGILLLALPMLGLGLVAAVPAQAWYDRWGYWHPDHRRYYPPPYYGYARPWPYRPPPVYVPPPSYVRPPPPVYVPPPPQPYYGPMPVPAY
ncbi:MAG: hypothetical protein JOZ17_00895 [Acetobacteraceae bacterium]|nr:hypothetical protein [Acetobacteraceae bacterium]